ncbi:hypothetical protein PFISCL1PPCAC_15171, partial [Pristionchus fissidentatus]
SFISSIDRLFSMNQGNGQFPQQNPNLPNALRFPNQIQGGNNQVNHGQPPVQHPQQANNFGFRPYVRAANQRAQNLPNRPNPPFTPREMEFVEITRQQAELIADMIQTNDRLRDHYRQLERDKQEIEANRDRLHRRGLQLELKVRELENPMNATLVRSRKRFEEITKEKNELKSEIKGLSTAIRIIFGSFVDLFFRQPQFDENNARNPSFGSLGPSLPSNKDVS